MFKLLSIFWLITNHISFRLLWFILVGHWMLTLAITLLMCTIMRKDGTNIMTALSTIFHRNRSSEKPSRDTISFTREMISRKKQRNQDSLGREDRRRAQVSNIYRITILFRNMWYKLNCNQKRLEEERDETSI